MRKYENYVSALKVLREAPFQDLNSEFVQSGIIGKFALQFELSWKLLKRVLSYEGDARAASGSPREIITEAYSHFDFLDEETWLSMLRYRSSTTHIYDVGAAKRLVNSVLHQYIPEFERLESALLARYGVTLTS
ncbi:nucleotidyltransferase substrate binding protein [Olsenella uli]|nr:nucleotidyltransferase substrate binding protein [Olsenella uli]